MYDEQDGEFQFARGSKRVKGTRSTSEPELEPMFWRRRHRPLPPPPAAKRGAGRPPKQGGGKSVHHHRHQPEPTPRAATASSSQICTRAGDKKDFSEE